MVESGQATKDVNQPATMDQYNQHIPADPPFEETYKDLFLKHSLTPFAANPMATAVEELELPLVDLGRLAGDREDDERQRCKREIAEASKEWGFFQVVNHGISQEILEEMRREQVKVFREPFYKKKGDKCMNLSLSPGSYRWGTPTATCLGQLSWSEAFHIPLTDISADCGSSKLSSIVKQFGMKVSELAQNLVQILATELSNKEESTSFFEENCLPITCYLRMNRYPSCPKYFQVFGLMPHTDSDFLTILYQDQVGGLQLVKDGKWIAVKPNPKALIVNIGDLFEIDDMERLIEIVKQAAKEGAMLVYTIADPSMAESARQACQLWDIASTDALGPITKAIASHLGVSPSGIPRGAAGRNSPLSEDYFRRIEAIEFTIKQDDGAQPQNLKKADIVLTGVSRTGKTPLSIYLAQKGYKVANVPIVMGVELPKTLFEIAPNKVFGLTINPVVLQEIRRSRAKTLGLTEGDDFYYSEMDYVKQDLEYARKIFAQNPSWPVIEVTSKAVEETAAIILGLYHDRKHKCWMPRISKRY